MAAMFNTPAANRRDTELCRGARESARCRDFSRGTPLQARRDEQGNAKDRRAYQLALVLPFDLVMRTILVSSAAALAVIAFAAAPAAQILTIDEVQRAMAAQEPAAHSKLRAHFTALSARYAADAQRHLTFARSAAGAARGAGVAAARHHERMAELAKEAATLTAELAMHHQTLAAGLPSTAPLGGEAFEAGAGAPDIPSERRLLQLAARAERPSEHGELREYYLRLAAQAEANAKEHRAMAKMYRVQSRVNEPAAAQCDRLAKLDDRSASEARALAREHQ
jgi:hypothetical protein